MLQDSPIDSPPRPFRPAVALVIAAAAIVGLPHGRATAADRVRLARDNADDIDTRDCVRHAAEAVATENLDAYVGCFVDRQQPLVRRRAALVFVRHELGLELLDSQLIGVVGQKADVAVRYRLSFSETSYDIVSVVSLVREKDAWRIAREQVQSRRPLAGHSSPGDEGVPVFRFGGGGELMLNPPDDMLPADIGRRPGG